MTLLSLGVLVVGYLLYSLDMTLWSAAISGASQINPQTYVCDHKYTIEIMSIDPLVLYINGFLSEPEVNYIVKLRLE